jgi:hypothetical protein
MRDRRDSHRDWGMSNDSRRRHNLLNDLVARMANQMTVGDLEMHLTAFSEAVSNVLIGLAQGKYDKEVAVTEDMLNELSTLVPQAAIVEKGLEVFLMINKATAPDSIVPDGRGGVVPATNSPVDPKTGAFTPKG